MFDCFLNTPLTFYKKEALVINRSSHHRCSVKKVFFKISQISLEKNCDEVFFNENAGLKTWNFIKKRL